MKSLRNGLLFALLSFTTATASAQGILIVGDSISAAFGLELEQGWVHLLQKRLRDEGYDAPVINASVSGDTTAGGLARLPRLLEQHDPDLVVIELGGNDGLRALPPGNMQQNLSAMVERSRESGADVVLLGMMIPPNYGLRYTRAFSDVFNTVSEQHEVPLVPFLLEGIGDRPQLMQADRIHPTAEAQPQILENAWPVIEGWLDDQ